MDLAFDRQGLSEILSSLARKYRVPGAQLAIHRNGETVAIEVGELQYEAGNRVTRDTAFPVGSISKTFTATVAMILVADGDLELDAPLGDHVIELDDQVARLTLRQVLSHTSGFASDAPSEDLSSVSIRRYVLDHCRSQNLVLSPGAAFSYSNIGYVLSGRLIEVITGMSWSEAVEALLLRPLGIEPAFISGADRATSGRPLATGHSVNAMVGRTRPVQQSLMPAKAPAGALAVSAVDLVHLGLMHCAGTAHALLPAAYAAQMRQTVTGAEPFGLADGWGLGLALFRSADTAWADTAWVGHDGNSDGTACYFRVDPGSGCVIAFTSNASIGLGMWQDLVVELDRVGIPIRNHSSRLTLGEPTASPSGCVGSYHNGDVEYAIGARQDGRFYLSVDGEAVARLSFHDGLTFFQQDLDSGEWTHAGRFLQNPITGDLDRIQVDGRVARRLDLCAPEDGRCQSLDAISA
ncbi:MAG TPA: serine hydrolase domain-containing protein [Pseudonocardiaceae bacterium]